MTVGPHGQSSADVSYNYVVLLAIVALVPLPFGSIYQWSWAGLGVIVGVALFAWCIAVLRGRRPLGFGLGRVWLPLVLFAAAVAWALVQASGMTPPEWHHPFWATAAASLDAEITGAVSLAPYESGSAAVRMAAFATLFWLFAQYGRSGTLARRALIVLVVAGAAYAAYGIAAELSGSGTVLWFEKRAYRGSVTGTFVNRNIYAAYAGLGFLCVLALTLKLLFDQLAASTDPRIALRELLAERAAALAGLALAGIVLLSALLLTGSRGGVIATAFGTLVLLLLLARNREPRTRRLVAKIGFGFLAVTALFFGIAGAYLGGRVAESGGLGGRIAFYGDLIAMIAEVPWTGYGAGAYLDAYYLHTDPTYPNIWNYAHNSYLQLALELGIPAAVAVVMAVGLLCLSCWRGLARRRRDHAYPALGLAATALVGVHGLFDDPLIVPAVAAVYSAILGIAFAQSWSTAPPIASPRPRPIQPARPAFQPERSG